MVMLLTFVLPVFAETIDYEIDALRTVMMELPASAEFIDHEIDAIRTTMLY